MIPSAQKNLSLTSAINATVRHTLEEYLRSNIPTAKLVEAESANDLFHSAKVEELKTQIVAAGQKLWQREYVDGNGGNISARISDRLVLCTPTLCSKGDLKEQDLCIVDLENRLVFGVRRHTSELLLHLEIYKRVPEAMAVIHCHPPYSTAHAVAGVIPQANLIPEKEVFIGPVALAPYDTPGTQEFAETIRPFVPSHNTILLANHGIVCWADTVYRAEWLVEIIETYCKTIMIAARLRNPLPQISEEKIPGLLAIRKRVESPDATSIEQDVSQNNTRLFNSTAATERPSGESAPIKPGPDLHELADLITAQIIEVLEGRV